MVRSLSCLCGHVSVRDISPVSSVTLKVLIYKPSAAALLRPSSSEVSGLNEMLYGGGGSLASVSQRGFF